MESKKIKNIAVIFAGGVGKRMRSKDIPKQFLKINDKPIIIHTIEQFEKNSEIDAIVISCLKDKIDFLTNLLYTYRINKVKKIVSGGETGQLSIYNGLVAAKEISKGEKSIVLIHDGVRPLISSELISKNIQCVKEFGSSITTGNVIETVVETDSNNNILNVLERSTSRIVKAPQCFFLDDILLAHEKALKEGITNSIDSCSLMQRFGYKMHLTEGENDNIKITTSEDFYLMRAILDKKEDNQLYGYEE